MTTNQQYTPMPDDPRIHPAQAVDSLEEKIDGERHEQQRSDEKSARPDFQQDIDPADTTADEGGHTDDESPV